MARPTLMTHRKFGRLARAIGSAALARGILEILWDGCYEAGDDYLGTAADIEQRVGWEGEAGRLALALVSCGLPEGHGFIEPVPADKEGQDLTYRVHDLWHHAPDYVMKRHKREMERRQKVEPVAVDRRSAPNGGQRPGTPDCLPGLDLPPAPAPAPAQKSGSPETLTRSEPAVLTFPVVGSGGQTAWPLTAGQIAEWSELFPGLDILAEARKALAWVQAHQGRRKTARGMRAFLVGWFTRTVNRGRPAVAATPPVSGPTVPSVEETERRYLRRAK